MKHDLSLVEQTDLSSRDNSFNVNQSTKNLANTYFGNNRNISELLKCAKTIFYIAGKNEEKRTLDHRKFPSFIK
jgi:hypothetical protein